MSGYGRIDTRLVEDDARDAEMTLRALRERNLDSNVHWVKDGEQALGTYWVLANRVPA